VPTPTPVPLVCTSKLDEKDCNETGGKYDIRQKVCICPK